jgi:hypothetical protein
MYKQIYIITVNILHFKIYRFIDDASSILNLMASSGIFNVR